MWKLLLISTTFLLTACAGMPALQEVGARIQAAHVRTLQAIDARTAGVIEGQTGFISYRAPDLEQTRDIPPAT